MQPPDLPGERPRLSGPVVTPQRLDFALAHERPDWKEFHLVAEPVVA